MSSQFPDSAGLDWARTTGSSSLADNISIQGVPCKIFEPTDFEPVEHLIPWPADENVHVDRYDGLLLLDNLEPKVERYTGLTTASEQSAERELDIERYADLRSAVNLPSGPGFTQVVASEIGNLLSDKELLGVEYSYSTENDDDANESGLEAPAHGVKLEYQQNDEAFQPNFEIPSEIAAPSSARMHKIISQTAKFIRGAGKQSIFLLRVKQADNPNFAFLMPQDPLHPYFNWLLEENSEDHGGTGSNTCVFTGSKVAQEQLKDSGDALSLLSNYESEDGNTPTASGTEVTKMAASSSEQLLWQPAPADSEIPVELRAIIKKLVKFIQNFSERILVDLQKSGARFEASVREREKSNPKFGFMQPTHEHFAFYRDEIISAVGPEEAEKMLPKIPIAPIVLKARGKKRQFASTDQQVAAAIQKAKEAAKSLAESSSAPSLQLHKKIQRIRANPAMINMAYRPLPDPKGKDERSANPEGHAHQGNGQASTEELSDQAPAAEGPAESSEKSLMTVDDDSEFWRSTAGPPQPQQTPTKDLTNLPEPSEAQTGRKTEHGNAVSEDERKAQRRRLARELLQAKLAKKEAEEKKKHSSQIGNIAHHRLAFLVQDDDVTLASDRGEEGHLQERQEQGSIESAVSAFGRLPQLEELLETKRTHTVDPLSSLEVLPEAKHHPEKGTREQKRSSNSRGARKKEATGSRGRSPGNSDSDSDRSRRKRRSRSRSRSRSRPRRQRSLERGSRHRSSKTKRSRKDVSMQDSAEPRNSSHLRQTAETLKDGDALREQIRLMLRS